MAENMGNLSINIYFFGGVGHYGHKMAEDIG